MDLDAFMQEDLTSEETKEAYRYFMRPEPKDIRGPIEVDPETGQRSRLLSVGMLRNAPEDQRKVMRVYLDPFPHIRIPNAKPLQGWYKSKVEKAGVRDRPCFTDAVLTEPYGGFCPVGCAFCYVNSGFRGYRGSGLISVPMDYGDQVAKMLARMKTSAAGYFSSFTDPFLALEDVYHNTERGARAFVREGLPIFFLSRRPYPGWAFDLLGMNRYSYMQKSINTPSEADWKKLSPGAAPLAQHFAEIREARKRGIYVSIQVNPVMAGVVSHDDVEHLFELLAEAGANHVIVKFVEAGYSWAPAMVERMTRRFGPERGARFAALFTENIGGQKTIVEDYRMEGHVRYKAKATKLGLTYATCYEYRFERDASGRITSKTGVSVGRDFTTADQCHGHKVPMFTRNVAGRFQEVPECAPSGCLYCAPEGSTKGRCGSDLFGSAPALRGSDFQVGVYDKPGDGKRKLKVL